MIRRSLGGALALLMSLTLVALATGTPAGAAPPPARTTTPVVPQYLSLGDSLAVGYQPDSAGVGRETRQGYVNDLYRSARAKHPRLKLTQLGCPGDTTTSLLTGHGNALAARHFHCDRAGGSQLTAALAFLKAHHRAGEVPLITIDIGANDVDGCASDTSGGLAAVTACVEKGVKSLETNTPKILRALRAAAPRGTTLAAMNLYDPILADELSSDANAQNLGKLSLALVSSINSAIARADRANHFLTADVASAFSTFDTTATPTAGTPLASSGMASVPADVATICGLTWMCAAPPVGPNIHANATGYTTIAGAFAKVLPRGL